MSAGQWRPSLFDDARRAELKAIEEKEFQERLRARKEQSQLTINTNNKTDTAKSVDPPHRDHIGDIRGGGNEMGLDSRVPAEVSTGSIVTALPISGDSQSPSVGAGESSGISGSSGMQQNERPPPMTLPNGKERQPQRTSFPSSISSQSQMSGVGTHPASGHSTSTKRPNVVSAFSDDRRLSATKRPKPVTTVQQSSSRGANRTDVKKVATTTDDNPRKPRLWYQMEKRVNTRMPGDSNVDVLLGTLRDQIKKAQKKSRPLAEVFVEVRARLHKVVFLPVTASLLKKNWMLDNRDGLPLIFDDNYSAGVEWPWDIKADAEELYNKWNRRIFETDLLRGIISQKFSNNKSQSERLDPAYNGKVSANYHGNGDLVNGQWWPTRLTMLRDGAHGETQAGISGAEGKGAFACVMSGGLDNEGKEYPDEDHRDWVLYCGTDSSKMDGKVSAATQRMLESVNGEPVRLIRSSEVRSPFAPQIGYRYDGLYAVVGVEQLDSPGSLRQRHRFRLERLPGQTPLRGGDGPEKRPTMEEIEAYQKMQKGLRGDSSI